MARESQDILVKFPHLGINVVSAQDNQPDGTCVDALNVRLFDSIDGRARGGSRPGLSKYLPAQINGSNRIQDVNYATLIANSAPSTTSLGVRTVQPVAVSNGVVVQFNATVATNATAGGARSLSNTATMIFSAELFGRLYYTDGTSYKIWVGSNNTTSDWTPTAGTLPGTDGTRVPRLIEMWRSRMVLSGLASDPHNWWMSKLGDPLDWDTAPAEPTETQAVEGGVGVVGKIGDKVNCIIPYSDDVLIFGCDHSIWQMSGDPQAGGRVDMVSDVVGMAFGRPYCKDGMGNVYFFSNRGGVYTMTASENSVSMPQSISINQIAPEIEKINLNSTMIRMAWNEEQFGFHLFLTPFVQR